MADVRPPDTDHAGLVARYGLDAGGFSALEALTDFIAALCEAPIAFVCIIENDRQHMLAANGPAAQDMRHDTSFCAHVMNGDAIVVIPDARQDAHFSDHALVTGAPHIRFFAGARLVDREGSPIGALCVMDGRPRDDLTAIQRQGLSLMARQVTAELDGRRRPAQPIAQPELHDGAVSEGDQLFRTLADTMPQMVWSTLPDGYHDYYNARWYEYTGMAAGTTDGDGWNGMFHPEDQERAWSRWRHSLETGEPYEIEYRLRHRTGDYRWTLGRALPIRDDAGRIIRWIGTCTEIHEQKLMMEERDIIAHELSHRIKNIFSVISGLIGLSARQRPDMRELADDLRDRIMALGRAHDFVRPYSAALRGAEAAGLRGILGQIFAPYEAANEPRIILSGDNPAIDDRSATPLALLFHELATNAAKYGALSGPGGRVHIHVSDEGPDIRIDWREEGGPPVLPPSLEGFGSRLMQLSVERKLGGRMIRDWRAEGLAISLWIPHRSMSRETEGKA